MPNPVGLRAPAARAGGAVAAIAATAPRWLVLIVAALAARIFALGNPLVDIDEQFYLLVAQRMLEGATLYVDLWDRKPVGLFLLYAPAALFRPEIGVWVYQSLALASIVATALLIARIAELAGWRRGALAAALLYVFMLNFGDGQGGQAPIFYNLLTAAAVLAILPRERDADHPRARRMRGLLAMALVGLALQVKYSVVFEGVFLGLWLMWREHRLGSSARRVMAQGAALVAAAMTPTLLAGTVFAALGHGDAWTFANFGSILQRGSDPAATIGWSLFKIALMLVPLLVAAGLGWSAWRSEPHGAAQRTLLFGWLIAAVLGLLLFGGYFSHYSLPVMLPASLCCAGWFARGRAGALTAAGLLAIAMFGGIGVTFSARQVRGDGVQLARLAEAIGPGRDCIYVYSGAPILYSYTGRCAPSPWLFPSHLWRERENGALGVDQAAELDRVFAMRPEFVVVRPPVPGERKSIRRQMERHLARDGYTHSGDFAIGRETVALFARQATSATAGAEEVRRAASSAS